jgi:hypothetical protein
MPESSPDRPESVNGDCTVALQRIREVRAGQMLEVNEAIVRTSRVIRLRMQGYLLHIGIYADCVVDCASCLLEMDEDFMSLIGSAAEDQRTAENRVILTRHRVPSSAFDRCRLLVEEEIQQLAQSLEQQKSPPDGRLSS